MPRGGERPLNIPGHDVPAHRTRGRAGDHRVDHDRQVRTAPRLDQLGRIALVLDHGDLGRQHAAQQPGHLQPGGVVAPQLVADPMTIRSSMTPLSGTGLSGPAQVQEVRRAGDARVVVADRLLAAVPPGSRRRQVSVRARRRRAGRPRSRAGSARSAARCRASSDHAVARRGGSGGRAVPRGASVRAVAGAGAGLDRRPTGASGSLVGRDEAQRLVAGVERSRRAHDDAAERVAADRAEARLGGRGPGAAARGGRSSGCSGRAGRTGRCRRRSGASAARWSARRALRRSARS